MAWQPSYEPRDAVRAQVQMSRALRRSVLALCTLLWVSGIAWLALHLLFEPRTEFGPLPHPWEPLVMRVHGLLAVVSDSPLGRLQPVISWALAPFAQPCRGWTPPPWLPS
jgi:hypothetical protein